MAIAMPESNKSETPAVKTKMTTAWRYSSIQR
jgi:hypothetical protein